MRLILNFLLNSCPEEYFPDFNSKNFIRSSCSQQLVEEPRGSKKNNFGLLWCFTCSFSEISQLSLYNFRKLHYREYLKLRFQMCTEGVFLPARETRPKILIYQYFYENPARDFITLKTSVIQIFFKSSSSSPLLSQFSPVNGKNRFAWRALYKVILSG